MKDKLNFFLKKARPFIKRYWRELAVVAMFLIVQLQIVEIQDQIRVTQNIATRAAIAARNAWNSADDAVDYASEAASAAQDASDYAYYCAF